MTSVRKTRKTYLPHHLSIDLILLAGCLLMLGVFNTTPVEAQSQFVHQKTITSPSAQDGGYFGKSIARIGDVNGDGVSDIVIGAERENAEGKESAGRAYLVSGADGSVIRTLTSPNSEGFASFGASVDGLGDVDGDGVPDVAVGAFAETVDGTGDAGRVYLMSGADGDLIRTLTQVSEGAFFGNSVAGLGDLNGDGTPDVIVGASGETVDSRQEAGRAYIIDGASGNVLQTLEPENPTQEGRFGATVVNVGDIDGDGDTDAVVGAFEEEVDGNQVGRLYFISGTDGSVLHTWESPSQYFRNSTFDDGVSQVADVDDDGISDVIVGADENFSAYLVSGADGSTIQEFTPPSSFSSGGFGASVTGTGDINEDGVPEVAISADDATVEGVVDVGRVYIMSGADGSLIQEIAPPNVVLGSRAGDVVESLGDLDGDGTVDLAFDSRTRTGSSDPGLVYVFQGASAADSATVTADGSKSFGGTGVEIQFSGVSESGGVSVAKFGSSPTSTDGITEENVSSYRFVADTSNGLEFESAEMRLDVSTLDGIDSPSEVTVYERPQVGSGSFNALSTTYDSSSDQLVVTVSGFSEFALASDTNPLPVELSSFDGTTAEDDVRLTWKTYSEKNNAGFEVQQKTSENPDWEEVGYVESKADDGTTTETHSYQYVVENLTVGTHEFRLKQLDMSGSTTLSRSIQVDVQLQQSLKLIPPAPNPVSNSTTLSFAVKEQAETTVALYNTLGQKVALLYEGTPPSGELQKVQLDASSLTSGTYFLRLQTGTKTATQRVTVVR